MGDDNAAAMSDAVRPLHADGIDDHLHDKIEGDKEGQLIQRQAEFGGLGDEKQRAVVVDNGLETLFILLIFSLFIILIEFNNLRESFLKNRIC